MKTWKVLAGTALAVGAIALGPVACGDSATNCTKASDCSGNTPACDTGCGLCFKTCTVATEATDCTGGETCGALCAGSGTLACITSGTGGSGGTGGTGGTGGAGCTENVDCVSLPGYCGQAPDNMCHGVNCGAEANNTCGNTCSDQTSNAANMVFPAPNNGAQDPGGPVIISVDQADLDTSDAAVMCVQTPECGQSHVCGFNVRYYLPPGGMDLPTGNGAIYNAVLIHLKNGGFGVTYGPLPNTTATITRISADTIQFRGCFAGTANISSAVFIKSSDGKASNTMCYAGSTP